MKKKMPTALLVREKVCPRCQGNLFKLYSFPNQPKKIAFVCPKCNISMELEVLKLGLPGEMREYNIEE